MMLGVVLVGVWWHGSSLLMVLGERWRSVGHFLRDVGIALLLLMVTIAISAVGHGGGDASAANSLLPQGRTEMWLWVALSVPAGICEEAIYRGYLQRQFIAVTRNVPAGIVLSAAAFGERIFIRVLQALKIALLELCAGSWLTGARACGQNDLTRGRIFWEGWHHSGLESIAASSLGGLALGRLRERSHGKTYETISHLRDGDCIGAFGQHRPWRCSPRTWRGPFLAGLDLCDCGGAGLATQLRWCCFGQRGCDSADSAGAFDGWSICLGCITTSWLRA
jgi:hypothetical protein